AGGSIRGAGQTGAVQQSVVGPAAEVSGSGTAGGAHGSGLRSWREVSRARERALHAVFLGADFTVSISAGALQGNRLSGAAASLLDLREQRGGEEIERDAGPGSEQAVATSAGNADRR